MRRWALMGILLLSRSGHCSEEIFGTASQGASIGKRQVSARAAALGGNGASLEEGADSLLSNPAALARVQGLELGLHHLSWLANIDQESATAAGKLGSGNAWGLGLGWVDYGTIDAVDELGNSLGTVGAQDYSVALAWARAVGAGLSVGIAGRYGQEVIAGENLTLSSLDLGLHWVGQRWRSGLVFANVGSTLLSGDRGPSAMRGELSGDLAKQPGELCLSAGFSGEPQGLSRLQMGIEGAWAQTFVARLGYEARLGSTLVDGFAGASFGMGFVLGPLVLDYAYLPFGDLGAGQRLSLKWRPQPSIPAREEPKPVVAKPMPPPPAVPPEPPPIPSAVPTAVATLLPSPVPTPQDPASQMKITEDALELARKAEDRGNWDAALAIHQGLIGRFPKSAVVWRSLGDLQYRAGHREEAVDAYDHALQNGMLNDELSDWLQKYRSQP